MCKFSEVFNKEYSYSGNPDSDIM